MIITKNSSFVIALLNLLEAEYENIESYNVAISLLRDQEYKSQLTLFKKDHESHVDYLKRILIINGIDLPPTPGKEGLFKAVYAEMNLINSDYGIIKAMLIKDIVAAESYLNLIIRPDKWKELDIFLNKGLKDELRHKAWMSSIINNTKDKN
ncbi:MAG: hypothetical protein K0Q51_1317 [Rickettsiaceae bacterium]|jgi:hypothetical protein|nr:hypothetical protein [Rickettsiaceae bacterium]